MPIFYQVKLAADDGLQPPLVGSVHELECPKHIAVVGQRHGFLAVPHSLVHHLADVGGPVKQGVLGVAVKVAEGWHSGNIFAQKFSLH